MPDPKQIPDVPPPGWMNRIGEMTDAAMALYHLGTPLEFGEHNLADQAVTVVAKFYQQHSGDPHAVDCNAVADRVFDVIDREKRERMRR